MTPGELTDSLRQAMLLLLVISLPVLITALGVGLVVSLLQAVTQLGDPTLSFVPKMLGVLVVTLAAGPWILERIVAFARQMFVLP